MSSTQNIKMSSTQKNVVSKAKAEEHTTTITVGGTATTIQVTGTKVTIPASFGRRPASKTGNDKKSKMDKSKDKTGKAADTKPTPYYGEHCWAYGGEEHTRLEDEDFEDISERGAEEYGA